MGDYNGKRRAKHAEKEIGTMPISEAEIPGNPGSSPRSEAEIVEDVLTPYAKWGYFADPGFSANTIFV